MGKLEHKLFFFLYYRFSFYFFYLIVWFQKISIPPPPRKTFWFAPPLPPGFSLPGGSLMTPPPLRNFQKFCTYKKESKYQLSYVNTIEFYYNSVNIKVNFNKNITLCWVYYPAKVLASSPSTLQIMFVLFLCKIISLNIWVARRLFRVFVQTLMRTFHSIKQLRKQ